uniref:Uncharacterized protein n=1 Tax=Romanomermis culicivorax TaxID=13658 RepID=A0A915IUT4_ROMCU
MKDYGLVEQFESTARPNHFYFLQKNNSVKLADGSTTDNYQCINCDKLGDEKGRTKVKNNRIISNPEVGQNHLCVPMDAVTIRTLTCTRKMIKVAENETKPIRAYRDLLRSTVEVDDLLLCTVCIQR